jgi:hypothetical protein
MMYVEYDQNEKSKVLLDIQKAKMIEEQQIIN